MNQKIIGRIDKIDFPNLKLKNVKSKMDSGAFFSAIHCDKIEVFINQGKDCLRVIFLDPQNKAYTGDELIFEDFEVKIIKSSNGQVEKRYVVDLEVVIFSETYRTIFSLTNREMLKYPILIGRKLLNDNFIIDTSKTNLSYNLKQNE